MIDRNTIGAARAKLEDALRYLDTLEEQAQAAPTVAGPKWLTYEQAAEYLGMSVDALYKATARGKVTPSGKNGRYVRFTVEDLDRFLAGGR